MMDQSFGLKFASYKLDDHYQQQSGQIFLTGTQALTRLPLMQRDLDIKAGLNTAGFISGYRGSPLGGYDQQLWRAKKFLEDKNIHFMPAVNEDLAVTAVLGTQQVDSAPGKTVDGVFAIWYGKGPGVDRSGDALKHGNAYGSSPNGGVLVMAGDDHGCVSSSMSHQSDGAFQAWFMPILNPSNVADYLEFGLWGWALSRFSGMWVGFKAISETVESAMTVSLQSDPVFRTPDDFTPPATGLHYRWPDLPGPQIEARLVPKLEAVQAFARANPIDKRIYDVRHARYGIITTGKAHLDLMTALSYLGLDRHTAHEIGFDIYKVGMSWPLEKEGLGAFLEGKQEVLVVEEKRGIVEAQVKEYLFDTGLASDIRLCGKRDHQGHDLIPWIGELSPSLLAPIVAARLDSFFGTGRFGKVLEGRKVKAFGVEAPGGVKRMPYFCSGCPHNTSTKVPKGSEALAGIGCHFMANWMNRDTQSLVQMGGEGVNWITKSLFTGNGHIFQNLGEGTYYHSGSMAIRQAIAAGANITYKILFNDAVAMTGGQPVDGPISVDAIARQVRAEGVERIALLSDDTAKYQHGFDFPTGLTIHHRDDLDAVQRALRDTPGVTVLIYDQACAAEKRRRRKRGTYPDPAKRIFINHLVCEGCGDCSDQSNCLSIVPKETEFGRKRKVDQSSCNKDYSCVKGFCPSFITVEGGELNKATDDQALAALKARFDSLPEPDFSACTNIYDLLVVGVGGTGVVTVGQVITMAAHLEGRGSSVLDFMGFAQKGGAVLSYVRLADKVSMLNQVRIDQACADALIACDMVVATEPKALSVINKGKTKIVVNATELPTADFVQNRDANMHADVRMKLLSDAAGDGNFMSIAANSMAEQLLGDSVFSNMLMLGFAWQQAIVPVSRDALMRAIELNGVAVEKNKTAFELGRLMAVDPSIVQSQSGDINRGKDQTLEAVVERRYRFLIQYQNRAYADDYKALVDKVRAAETALCGEEETRLSETVARYYFKLKAYKDEYEVARLHTLPAFRQELQKTFKGRYRIKYNMAPPLLSFRKDAFGRPKKQEFGGWMTLFFRVLAMLKGLRGTPFDPFGYTAERRSERALISRYRNMVDLLLLKLEKDTIEEAQRIAAFPRDIRGFGPVKEESISKTIPALEARLKAYREGKVAQAAESLPAQ